MFRLFRRNDRYVEVKSPLRGRIIDLSQVPDEAFSNKMVGDGFAIEPYENVIYSPVDGEIIQVFPTGHAVGIRTKEGLELLIHIGIDTVEMKGEGFIHYVKSSDYVNKGDKLIVFDMELIRKRAKSNIIPVVITNMEVVEDLKVVFGEANKDTTVAYVKLR